MTAWQPDRDAAAVEALLADRYLEALLAAGDRRATDVPVDADLDAGIREAVRALRTALVRVHPSFRFEERLAGRLAAMASATTPAASAGSGSEPGLVPFAPPPPALAALDPDLAAIAAGTLDPAADVESDPRLAIPRPVLVGGAVASAALSVMGLALVVLRAVRATPDPMARAARAVRRRRLSAGLAPGRLS